MASCRQCDYRIRHQEVFAWVNSGIKSHECNGCGRKIASSAELTFIYFIWAIAMVAAVNYRREIAIYIQGYGIDIAGIVLAVLLAFLYALMIYVSAFFLASWKA